MKTAHTMLAALLLASPGSAWAQAAGEKSPTSPSEKTPPPSEGSATNDSSSPGEGVFGDEGAEDKSESGAVISEDDEAARAEKSEGEESEAAAATEVSHDGAAGPQAQEQDAQAEGEEPANVKRPPNPDAIPDLQGAALPTQRGPIGLEPGAPQAAAMAGGVTPAFGRPSSSSADWVFDIHGYLQLPLRVGLNERENPLEGQKKTVLHTPPVIPGTYGTFEYTGLIPDPWAQLNFSYGNHDVTATVIIAARTVSNANGYFDPSDQLGINDAFITFHPHSQADRQFQIHVGAFANRYGIMGEYDMGRYGTPLIGRTGGMGVTATGQFNLGEMDLTTEAGVVGSLNKAPIGVEPAGWNGYTDPNAGTTFALHGHAALGLSDEITVGAHVIHAFAQDDRATTTVQKDGNISVFGGDARFSLRRFGHLYFGYAHTDANTARSVSGVLRVLNAAGGLGLMEEYFGLASEGTGELNTFGSQYDLSVGNLLRYPEHFHGKGPDLVLSGFTIGTHVSSPVPEYDGVFKFKYGGEATYALIQWLGVGLRYDRVLPDVSDSSQTHAALSPRVIFKSDWASRDQVVLQYTRYFYGSNTAVVTGTPPAKDYVVVPDPDVLSLTAQIWW